MSELRTNRIVPRDGLVSGANGGIIQVVHANKKNLQNFNSTVPSFTDLAGLSLSITPTRSDSKILLSYNIYVSADNTVAFFRILRGSTFIEGPSGTPSTNGRSGHSINYINTSTMQVSSATILDSPSTTSALTYKIQAGTHDGSTVQINSWRDDTANYFGVSTFTAMEVSG
tara:strand:+ start:542 stop:1054 length:513 start_codon:yes stop_codon:yes gene_type:complete